MFILKGLVLFDTIQSTKEGGEAMRVLYFQPENSTSTIRIFSDNKVLPLIMAGSLVNKYVLLRSLDINHDTENGVFIDSYEEIADFNRPRYW